MHCQRHDDFRNQSPAATVASSRLRDPRNRYLMMSRSPRTRRSLSPPPRRVAEVGSRVIGGYRRSNSLEKRDYGWYMRGCRGERIRSRSPPVERVRERSSYGVGVSRKDSPLAEMHKRDDFYECMDRNADLRKEYEYVHNTSRVVREDFDGMFAPKSRDIEDGTGGGMYRLPSDMGPTSKFIESSSLTSEKVGLDRFGDERIEYSEPLLSEKFSAMQHHDKGAKPMFCLRDAPYPTVPASRSKDFMETSQFKDFASTSSGNSRANLQKSHWDGIPLPTDEHFRDSVKPTEHMGFGEYGERRVLDSGRNFEAEHKDLTCNRRETFSPTRAEHHNYLYNRAYLGESDILDTGRDPNAEDNTHSRTRTNLRDYLYPRPGVREADDYPSVEIYSRMSERLDYESRPKMIDPVTERYDTIEFSRRNLASSSLWDHPSPEKQPFSNHIGTSRSSTVLKDGRQYLDSVSAQLEFERKVSREQEIPYLDDVKDPEMFPMISHYRLARDADPMYHKERMRRLPEFHHEREMHRPSVRTWEIEGEEYGSYNSSKRMPKRKQSTEEEMNLHDPKNIVSTKWNSSIRKQEQEERGEEWIGQHTRSSYYSKRVAYDREINRRAERISDRIDKRRLSAYDDRLSSHDEYALERSMNPHRFGDKYFKGNSKSGSRSWYNSYQYDRKHALPKRNNVWIRGKDGNQVDVHANEGEQSENQERSAKSELTEDSEEFKQLVHDYFLSFTRKLNDNPAVRRRYKEQGRAGSLFCIVCGRSESKEFTDTQRLVTHAFMSHKVGLRAQHLGLHKAICVLLGWNSVVSPDVITWFPETISNAEALAQKEDLIIWPPVIVIHNSSTSDHVSERQRGITVEALEDFIRGKGVSGGKVKIVNPAIMVVKFLGTITGLQDAEKLHSYFAENNRGRIDFGKISYSKGKSSKIGERKIKGGKLDELLLYGYMGIAEDLDRVDFDTKKKCSIKSKKEIKDMADAPVKPE